MPFSLLLTDTTEEPVTISESNLQHCWFQDFMQLPMLEPQLEIAILSPVRIDRSHLAPPNPPLFQIQRTIRENHTPFDTPIHERFASTTWRYQIAQYGFPYAWKPSFSWATP